MRRCSEILSMALILTLLTSTMPLSASDGTPARTVLGTISTVGSVQVRGLRLPREGTLFSGDQIRTDKTAYAKLSLPNFGRVEVAGGSEFVVTQESNTVRFGLTSGHLGFTASGNLLGFTIGRYEVLPRAGSSGGIGFLGPEEAAINVLSGSVTLREPATKQSFVIPSGGEYTVNLKSDGPIAQSVSLIPPAIPTVPDPQGGPAPPATSPPIRKKIEALWFAVGGSAITAAVLALSNGSGTNEVPTMCAAQEAQAIRIANSVLTTAQQTQTAIAPVLSSNAVARAQNTVLAGIIVQLNTDLRSLQNTGSCATVAKDLDDIQRLQAQLNLVLTTLTNANLPITVQIPGKNTASDSRP